VASHHLGDGPEDLDVHWCVCVVFIYFERRRQWRLLKFESPLQHGDSVCITKAYKAMRNPLRAKNACGWPSPIFETIEIIASCIERFESQRAGQVRVSLLL
jgi:hypothetical protein